MQSENFHYEAVSELHLQTGKGNDYCNGVCWVMTLGGNIQIRDVFPAYSDRNCKTNTGAIKTIKQAKTELQVKFIGYNYAIIKVLKIYGLIHISEKRQIFFWTTDSPFIS